MARDRYMRQVELLVRTLPTSLGRMSSPSKGERP